jgi:glycosyltransferase involved in cell wall biosynthesis
MQPESRTRIAFLTSSLGAGGAQAMLVKVMQHIDRETFEPVVVSLRDTGIYGEQIRRLQVPVHCLDMNSPLDVIMGLRRLRRVLRQLRPGIIQGWMYHGNLAASVGRRLARTDAPVAWNVRHSIHDISQETAMMRFLIRLSAKLSRAVSLCLYPSEAASSQHRRQGFLCPTSRVIPNGFATDLFSPPGAAEKQAARSSLGLNSDQVVVVHLARYHPMKNHAGFLAAIRVAARKVPALRVLMAGAGVSSKNEVLSNLACDLGIAERLHMLGEVADVRPLLVASDFLCVSSSWGEAFPNVIGEAMSMGVPCVATDVGDCRAIIGETGGVVPPADVPALAQELIRMGSLSPRERAVLGASARARVQREYEIGAVVRKYEECYKMLRKAEKFHG